MVTTLMTPAQANADRHPQRISEARWTFGNRAREKAIDLQQRIALGALIEHARKESLGAVPPPSATVALSWAATQLGKPYRVSGCRCQPVCYARDCSGLICYAVNMAGLSFPCTSSFAIARVCQQYGTLISEAQAIRTPGAIGIENPWGIPNGPRGSNGHIVFFTGRDINGNIPANPDQLVTVEEMGTRYGCVHGPATHRGFGAWAYFPGLSYAPPVPPRRKDADMLLIPIQPDHHGYVAGMDAYAIIAPDGKSVQAWYGASFDNDQATSNPHMRTIIPAGLAGATLVGGPVHRAADSIDPHDGAVVVDSNGVPHHLHYS